MSATEPTQLPARLAWLLSISILPSRLRLACTSPLLFSFSSSMPASFGGDDPANASVAVTAAVDSFLAFPPSNQAANRLAPRFATAVEDEETGVGGRLGKVEVEAVCGDDDSPRGGDAAG